MRERDFLLLLRVSSRDLHLLHERSDVGFQHKGVLIEGLRELESSFGDRLGSGPERYLLRRLTPEEGAGGWVLEWQSESESESLES